MQRCGVPEGLHSGAANENMNKELIVNVNPTEIAIALCEDKVLAEFSKEQCQTGFAVGDIYLGKVRKIMPGLNAAFVNIGHEKDAFIHYLDLGTQFPSLQKLVNSQQPGKRGLRVETMKLEEPIDKNGKLGQHLQVGQTVMVQIAKEAISTKGPRLTADISLAGRNVVLVPFRRRCFSRRKSVHRRKTPTETDCVIHFAQEFRGHHPYGCDGGKRCGGRTRHAHATRPLAQDRAGYSQNPAPAQLMSEMNRANTIIRDSLNGDFSQIVVNDEAMYTEIRNYIHEIEPAKEKIVQALPRHGAHLRQLRHFEANQVVVRQVRVFAARRLSHHRAHRGDERHRRQFGQPHESRGRPRADGDGRQSGCGQGDRSPVASARFGRHRHHRLHRPAQGAEQTSAVR